MEPPTSTKALQFEPFRTFATISIRLTLDNSLGKEFVNKGALQNGYFTLQPKGKTIHALRIVADGMSGGEGRVVIQPLIIK